MSSGASASACLSVASRVSSFILLRVRDSHVEVRREKSGIGGDHFLVLHNRLIGVAGVEIHRAEVGANFRIVRLLLQVMLVCGDRFVVALIVVVDITDTAQRVEVVGLQLQHVAVRFLGLAVVGLIEHRRAHRDCTEFAPCRYVAGFRARVFFGLVNKSAGLCRQLDLRMSRRQSAALTSTRRWIRRDILLRRSRIGRGSARDVGDGDLFARRFGRPHHYPRGRPQTHHGDRKEHNHKRRCNRYIAPAIRAAPELARFARARCCARERAAAFHTELRPSRQRRATLRTKSHQQIPT